MKNNPRNSYHHFKEGEILPVSEVQAKLKEYNLVFGHFRFDQELLDDSNFLFTFLRNPVDRCISHFLHYHRSGWLEDAPMLEQMERFLSEEEIPFNGNFNLMTQWMAGKVKQRDVFADPEKHLELAWENLQKLSFVGITEDFTNSALMLCQLLGWKKKYFIPQNSYSTSAERKLLLHNFQKRLTEVNEMDIELYRRALVIFEKEKSTIEVPRMERLKAMTLSTVKKVIRGRKG